MRFPFHLLFLAAIVASGCGDDYVPPPSTGGAGGSGGSVGTGGSSGSGGTGGDVGTGGNVGTGGTGGTAGVGGAAGSGGSAGSGGTGAVGGGGSGGTGGIAPMGACDNTDDLIALASIQLGNARQIAAKCGTVDCSGVVDEAMFLTCATSCVEADVPNLSTECATCFSELALCSGLLCNTACAGNPCVVDCQECNEGADYRQCLQALTQCAGQLPSDCPD
ncbi:MAG: hypothetical protein WBB42_16740 [Polyangiales bacterium]